MKAIFYASFGMLVFVLACNPRAIAQIAPGVTQSAAQTALVAGSVVQNDGTIVPAADVRLVGPSVLITKADALGKFHFTSVPYGTYKIRVSSAVGSATQSLTVNGDVFVIFTYGVQSSALKTIADVSTRSAGARINVTPASISSVDPRAYAFQGNTSWRQLLNQIPGVAVSGNLGGGNSTNTAIPDGPFEPVSLSINGAQAYETSTALDGMPMYNNSFAVLPGLGTNLAFLPMSMFDTADIVRGPGADAPSILNSIGGSFTLHAPGAVGKNQFEFSVNNDPYGGIAANARAALRIGKLSATITYGLNDSPGPIGTQSEPISWQIATPLTINGHAFAGCGPAGCASSVPDPRYNNHNLCTDSFVYGPVPVSSFWVQHSGAIALSYNLTPSVTAQLFYAGSSSLEAQPGFKAPVSFEPGASYAGNLAPGTYTSIGTYPYYGNYHAAESENLIEEKITAHLGNGVVRLAALQNNSIEQQSTPNFYPPNGTYTVWGTGYYTASPATQVSFNGAPASLTFPASGWNFGEWTNNRDFLVSYALQLGSRTSAGLSYVRSYYNSPCYYNFGPSTVGGNSPSANSQTTGEWRIFAAEELSERLSVDASWYSVLGSYHVQNPADATGNTYVDSLFRYSAPRVGAVWRPGPNVAIRGAAGGGYALPALFDLRGSNGVPFCTNVCTVSQVNLDLKPEESFGADIGMDLRLRRNTVLSIDMYRTNLYGQFYNISTLSGTYNGLPLFIGREGNLAQSRYEGVNFEIHHDAVKGFIWKAALGLTRGYVVSVPSGFYNAAGQTCDISTGVNCTNTQVVPGINFTGSCDDPVPYANGTVTLGYSWSQQKYVDIMPTYFGNNNPYFQPAFLEFDAHTAYPLSKNLTLLLTFRNITGVHGDNWQIFEPTLGAPSIVGKPFALFGLPYGPRSVTLTANASVW